MSRFIAQRLLPGGGGHFSMPDTWYDINDKPQVDKETCRREAISRVQAGEFGVVSKIRIVQVLEYNTFRDKEAPVQVPIPVDREVTRQIKPGDPDFEWPACEECGSRSLRCGCD
jgi:hypothetical protein